mgnify:CR=1 FL=1
MSKPQGAKLREINNTIRYAAWSVFRLVRPIGEGDRAGEAAQLDQFIDDLAEVDVVVRGIYDVSALRADADVMVWWHAATSEELQDAYNGFRRTSFGARLEPVWSQMALHRPAEFNKSHVPAFLAEEEPRAYVCIYPFVRSYEWYLLPDEERRATFVREADEAVVLRPEGPGNPYLDLDELERALRAGRADANVGGRMAAPDRTVVHAREIVEDQRGGVGELDRAGGPQRIGEVISNLLGRAAPAGRAPEAPGTDGLRVEYDDGAGAGGFGIGQPVRHRSLGTGRITAVSPQHGGALVTVRFASGEKTIKAGFLELLGDSDGGPEAQGD